jgi:1,4-alpha-glucan branching enzyme
MKMRGMQRARNRNPEAEFAKVNPKVQLARNSRLSGRATAVRIGTKAASSTEEACSYYPVAFTISEPEAKRVTVAGTFNDWDVQASPLANGENGEWSTFLPLKPGHYEYRFIVDGVWKEDPAARSSVPNPFGTRNSVIDVQEDNPLCGLNAPAN